MSTSVGPNLYGTATQTGTDISWSISGTSSAVVSMSPSGTGGTASNLLIMTNFGFSVPTNAIINGVFVEIEKYANESVSSGGRFISDGQVKLILSGTQIGSDKKSATRWPLVANKVFAPYGGPTDTWTTFLAASNINDSSFGVSIIAAGGNTLTDTLIGTIDGCRITISYSVGVPDLLPFC